MGGASEGKNLLNASAIVLCSHMYHLAVKYNGRGIQEVLP
jgi:hypothetical protein